MKKCKSCGMENDDAVRYCQGCGAQLKCRGDLLDSLNFSSLAGTGLRGTSPAPLFTSDLLGKQRDPNARGPRARVHPLPDGSWFCPDCGEHNAPERTFCHYCARDR